MKHLFLTGFKFIVIIFCVVFFLSLFIFVAVPDPEETIPSSILKVSELVNEVSSTLMWIRIFGYLVIWFYWDAIVEYLYKGKAPKAKAYLAGRRNFYLCMFLLIEMILIQNVLGALWA